MYTLLRIYPFINMYLRKNKYVLCIHACVHLSFFWSIQTCVYVLLFICFVYMRVYSCSSEQEYKCIYTLGGGRRGGVAPKEVSLTI